MIERSSSRVYGMRGLGEDLARVALLDDLPRVHHGDPVAGLGDDPEVVRDQQQRGVEVARAGRRGCRGSAPRRSRRARWSARRRSPPSGASTSASAIMIRWRMPPENSCGYCLKRVGGIPIPPASRASACASRPWPGRGSWVCRVSRKWSSIVHQRIEAGHRLLEDQPEVGAAQRRAGRFGRRPTRSRPSIAHLAGDRGALGQQAEDARGRASTCRSPTRRPGRASRPARGRSETPSTARTGSPRGAVPDAQVADDEDRLAHARASSARACRRRPAPRALSRGGSSGPGGSRPLADQRVEHVVEALADEREARSPAARSRGPGRARSTRSRRRRRRSRAGCRSPTRPPRSAGSRSRGSRARRGSGSRRRRSASRSTGTFWITL